MSDYDSKRFAKSLEATRKEMPWAMDPYSADELVIMASSNSCARARRTREIMTTLFLESTRSPIERLLGAGLLAATGLIIDTYLNDWRQAYAGEGVDARQLRISTQHRIGVYTADFFLTLSDALIFYDRSIPVVLTMVVECDGHDFHERTKEQAAHDKKRDRALQDAGHLVYRFTGSDIYRDPCGCAMQVVSAIEDGHARKSKALDAALELGAAK